MNPVKCTELDARAHSRGHKVSHIDLHDFIPVTVSGIANIKADFDALVTKVAHGKSGILERSIAQPIAERIEGCGRHLHIIVSRRKFLVIIYGKLSHINRNGHRKTACRAVISEKHVSKSLSALLARIELRQKRISIGACPHLVQRTSLYIYYTIGVPVFLTALRSSS